MTAALIGLIVVLVLALTALAVRHRNDARLRPSRPPASTTRRILFPFVASALSNRALDAALRLALAEDATLMPVFLARVPMTLPLDAPLPRQAGIALGLQDVIEQRASEFGIAVDARIERGRTLPPRAAPDDRQRAVPADRDRRGVPQRPGLPPGRRGMAAGLRPRRDRRAAPDRRRRPRDAGAGGSVVELEGQRGDDDVRARPQHG